MTDPAGAADRPLRLLAPLSGVLVPLDRVPDPVFAERMVGDGVSIDPISQTLVSPCDGRVLQMHSAAHAVTIATPEGLEVMMHIGIDTVGLKGQGFTPRVAVGAQVRTGEPLIDFDADYVATHARSLLTQVLITNGDAVAGLAARNGHVRAGEDVVLEVTARALAAPAAAPSARRVVATEAITVTNPTGLHARPAAVIASRARQFSADVRIRRGDRYANARSVVSIMGLEIGGGDTVSFEAEGPDAEPAIAALGELARGGFGDAPAALVPEAPVRDGGPRAPKGASADPNLIVGIPASPGLGVGNVWQVRHEDIPVERTASDPHTERRALDAALADAKAQLESLQTRLTAQADPGKAAIFAAHRELLEDPDLVDVAADAVQKGSSAAWAWREVYTAQADRLAGLSNELLAARANDLRDVGRRVLRILTGAERVRTELPPNTILIAEDLTPSDTASLDRARVLGFATTTGGASSHVAILARSLDIPAVMAIGPRALDLPNGTPVVLDGTRGLLQVNPSIDDIARIHGRQERQAQRRRTDLAAAHQPAVTSDGHRVEVVANIGGLRDAEQVPDLGGEGVGLLRSEFLFLDRTSAPDEDEQAEAYATIARALGRDRILVIRTLDVGGDKPLPYLPIAPEHNPFLGERGIRVLLDRPDLLRTQLRAILRASTEGRIAIMFPMIATLAEWRAARAMLEIERQRLGAPPVPVGLMVEIASAALLADHFAKEADFFSVGTNDLTQYTLAMDRTHPRLAPQIDGLHPSVLLLIAQTVRAAHAQGRWVGVCGGIAGDLQAVPILVGLGVDELSVSAPAIPAVKAQVRRYSLTECRRLAQQALDAGTAEEVRALVQVETE